MTTLAARAVIASVFVVGPANADEPHEGDDAAGAAHLSANPLPVHQKYDFDVGYTWSHGDSDYHATLEFEPWLPYRGVLIPGLVVDDLWSIARVQLTAESLQNTNGTASGLENLNFVDVVATQVGSWAFAGGFGTVFPMATSAQLGPAKWQLGPAVGIRFDGVPRLTIAGLAQALWSVAGSSEVANQSYVEVQPFITLFLTDTLFLKSNAAMNFFWRGGSTSAPVNLGLGYAFSKHFVGTVKGEVTAGGHDRGTVEGKIELEFRP